MTLLSPVARTGLAGPSRSVRDPFDSLSIGGFFAAIEARFVERAWAAGALVLSAALFVILLYLHRKFLHDDTLIALRYVRHFLEGQGLVWNPGERVEGYTSFLFLMLTSGLGALGVDLILAARLVNFAGLAMVGLALAAYLRRDGGAEHPLAAVLALAFALCSSPLIAWALGGLEAPLVAGLIALGACLVLRMLRDGATTRRAAAAGVVFGLAVLARPDAVVLAGCAGLFLLGRLARSRSRSDLAALLIFAALGSSIVIAHEAWRIAYYGDWLPNTYYAKLAGVPDERIANGLVYVIVFALRPPFVPFIAIAAFLVALKARERRGEVLYLAASIALHVGYVIMAGGDHMRGFRFMVPLLPFFALLLYRGLVAGWAHWRIWRRPAAALVIGAALASQALSAHPSIVDSAAWLGTVVGRYIHETWPKGTLIASSTAGSIPYFARDHRFIDTLGLNDRVIARRDVTEVNSSLDWQAKPGHAKGDGAYILSRKPDYIIFGPTQGSVSYEPHFLSDVELASSTRFYAEYARREAVIDVSAEPDFWEYPSAAGAQLRFTWYERIVP